MNRLKRITALLLSAFLILALVPPTAFAWTGPDISVPTDHELVYFVDCGASTFPSAIQSLMNEHKDTVKNTVPDQAYNGTWGYTNSADALEVNNPDSGDIYTSIRNFQTGQNGQTLQYKFDAPAGAYQVVVGLYDPWAVWNQSRKASVSVNNGAAQTFAYYPNAGKLTFDVTVTGEEDLTVNVAPTTIGGGESDVMASFIMVTRKVEAPAPTQPDAPTADTLIWGKGGENWKLDITYRCTNDAAAHQGGNEKVSHKNFISGQLFTFGEMTLNGDTWEVPATVDAAAMLEDEFGQPHTVTTNPQVTLEYVNNKWCIQSDEDKAFLTVEGTCAATGPALPALGDNLDVWFQLYAGEYKPVIGQQLSTHPSQYSPCLSFGQPYNDNGTWKCDMTITAYSQDETQAASCPANTLMPQGYEMDPAAVVNGTAQQTITLTYNQNKAIWDCPQLPRTQTANGPGNTTSPDKYGVAFLIVEEGTEPAPALPVPGETVLDIADDVWMPITYTCTNENSVHKAGNPVTRKITLLAKQYLKAVAPAVQDSEGNWTAVITLDAAAMITTTFGETHTADDVTLTVVYDEAAGEWLIPADATLAISGVCTSQGPAAPSKSNCTDFYVTIYGAEPKNDDSVTNTSLSSTRWDILGDKISVSFGTPTKGEDGVWTCTATVEAKDYVHTVAETKASSHYRLDDTDPTTKTVTLTYNQTSAKWVAASDGVSYGSSSKPTTKNGVAFRLIKQYEVTFAPGRDLGYGIPAGEAFSGGIFDKGATVELPETTTFTTDNGIFAGWRASIKNGTQTTIYFFPIGTDMTMFGQDVTLEAYWMDVELEVASVAYDPDLAVKDYTFAPTADFSVEQGPITLLYRAKVMGNSQYPYALTCDGATAVYDSALSGTIQKYQSTQYVYFTKTYTQTADLTETVTMGNAQGSAEVSIQVTGHIYGQPTFDWAEDGKSATVTFTCTLCGDQQKVEAKITSAVKTPATCTEMGVTTYTASVVFQDETYTDTKDVTDIPATGHHYGQPAFQWAEDGKSASAVFSCSCGDQQTVEATISSTVKTPATCTEMGVTTYTATVVFQDETYTDTKDLTDIPTTGHHYGQPTFDWAEDGKSATATFTCTLCGDQQKVEAKITSAVKTPATCTEMGVTTYTASVVFQDETYTDTKDLTDIPATGHHYVDGVCTQCGQEDPDYEAPVMMDNQSDTTITMDGLQEKFEKGTVVSIHSISSGEIYTRVQAALKNLVDNMEHVAVFEITATKDGVSVQPDGPVQVTFAIPSNLSADHLQMYYVAENGTKKAISITVDKQSNTVTANLPHFSTYVLVNVTPTQGDKVPPTGDTANLTVWLSVVAVCAVVLVAVVVVMNKKRTHR